jgi:hypothetical protein
MRGRYGRGFRRVKGRPLIMQGRTLFGPENYCETLMKIEPAGGGALMGGRREDDSDLIFTHFLSIPIEDKEFIAAYEKMEYELLEKGVKGLSPYFFQKSSKLHITIALLDLLNDQSIIEKCMSAIYEIRDGIQNTIGDEPLKFQMNELKHFGTEDASTGLYIQLVDSKPLEKLCKMAKVVYDHLLSRQLLKETHFKFFGVEKDPMNPLGYSFTPKVIIASPIIRKFKTKKTSKRKQKEFSVGHIIPEIRKYTLPDITVDYIQIAQLHEDNIEENFVVVDKFKLTKK